MVVAIIFLMIGIVLLAFGAAFDSHPTSALGGFFIGGFFIFLEPTKPSAIDVYRGKTTLEITYKDSVAVDSVVVFKDK